ncbi:MAG: tol-pal system protein YbgF [Geminicoccaceae bacterium]
MGSQSHRNLIVTAACLLGLAAGAADAAVVALAGPRVALRAELDETRGARLIQIQDSARLARFEVRLAQLEEEIRRLTGRIEQLEFGQRALGDRIDRLVRDLDQRLLVLEGGGRADAPGTAALERTQPAAPGGEAAAAADVPPGGEATLGSVPESALLDLPRPEPGSIAPPPKITSLPPQQQYDAAMQLLRAGDYAGAEGGLELFLELNPDHALAPNAAYWLAETHYVRKNYAAAAAAFARNYRLYGKDDTKAPDNLLKLGMSLGSIQETDKACRTFDELAREFPNAPAHIQQALLRERSRADCV